MMQEILLVPKPQKIKWLEGCYALRGERFADEVICKKQEDIPPEGYRLFISPEAITIEHSTEQGAFYARQTLWQIAMQCGGENIPCCAIEDQPGLPIRGLLLDISRDKIPTLATLRGLADFMASFKMNHLQLYIEGFSFAYPSFPALWENETPLTGEELRQLDAYCRERFIDLVPNQNCLGHMAPWLANEAFRPLAETEDGLSIMGRTFPPTTLNPLDPESLALVRTMTEDLLPNFTSGYCNANLDEPFELGKGKSRAFAEQEGLGRVYLNYAKQIHAMLAAKGKTMMMWGDVIAKHPEIAAELPKDIVVLEWGYEPEHPFPARTASLRALGQPFCVCPGTSAWNSFTGLTDAMMENIRRAAESAYAHGAQGMIAADWGDGGHLQYQPASCAGYVYSAAHAWNSGGVTQQELAQALDRFVFQDEAGVMGQFCLDAGRYYQYEEFPMPCRTLATIPLLFGYMDPEQYEQSLGMLMLMMSAMMVPEVAEVYTGHFENSKPYDHAAMMEYLDRLSDVLQQQMMQCPQAQLISREYNNALRMVRVLEQVRYAMRGGEVLGSKILNEIDAALCAHEALWNARNKVGGLQRSTAGFRRLREQIGLFF